MNPTLTIEPQPASTPLRQLVDDYLDSCRARGLSRRTIDQAYGYSLHDVFLPWCADQGITDVSQLSQRVLDRFTAALLDRPTRTGTVSPATVHSYVRPVRQVVLWAKRSGEETTGALPQLPRVPRKVRDVLSRAEIDRLEDAADIERDRLIVRVLADTGIRATELCQLLVGDITRHQGGSLLKIRGKGGKERLVPLRPTVARRLERFVRSRREATESDFIFVSRRRGRLSQDYEPLTRNGVLQLLYDLAERARLTKHVYTHLLRHSFATEALRRGMSPVQLANVLGHSGLRMIERTYAHLNVNDAYEAVLRALGSD
jgi:site-specific recombinase XerD